MSNRSSPIPTTASCPPQAPSHFASRPRNFNLTFPTHEIQAWDTASSPIPRYIHPSCRPSWFSASTRTAATVVAVIKVTVKGLRLMKYMICGTEWYVWLSSLMYYALIISLAHIHPASRRHSAGPFRALGKHASLKLFLRNCPHLVSGIRPRPAPVKFTARQ